LIGGGGEKVTLRIVAEHADIWHPFGGVETIAHKSQVLAEWCTKVGRDPSTIKRSVGIQPWKVDKADAYAAVGVTEFTLGFTGPDIDLSLMKGWLEWRDRANGAGE
jgi:alkanesulfonate monooxygenase SsuD/methylene tetrahydromethanopterin reductase-like flavin-dependent oxidoreductase (luciferase family)